MSSALSYWQRRKLVNGCIRTGFTGYVKDYGLFIHGDLFRYGDVYIVRISQTFYNVEISEPINMRINKVTEWFDRHKEDDGRVSTLIAMETDCSSFSYDGVPSGSVVRNKPINANEQ